MIKKYICLVILGIFLFSCFYREEVFILSSNKELLLPFEIAEFFGKAEKSNVKLNLDVVDTKDLIKFLNFSKYSLVITDNATANRILKLLPNWYRLCIIAKSKGGVRYYLLVKKRFLMRKKIMINVVQLWNFGVYELKDPAVSEIFFKKSLNIKLLPCGK